MLTRDQLKGTSFIGGAPRQFLVAILKARANEVRNTKLGELPADIDSWADRVESQETRKLTLVMLKDYFQMGRYRRRTLFAIKARKQET